MLTFTTQLDLRKTTLQSLKLYVTLALMLIVISGCTAFRLVSSTKLEKPTFEYSDHEITKTDGRHTVVDLFFEAHNPNEIGLKNIVLAYKLSIDDKKFLKGSGIEVNLAPASTTRLTVPADVVYKDVLRALGPTAFRILLLEQKKLPVDVEVVMIGNPTVYNEIEEGKTFSFKLTSKFKIKVPVPQDEVKKAKKELKNSLKKLF